MIVKGRLEKEPIGRSKVKKAGDGVNMIKVNYLYVW
jgi:hypothetical protein